jgi:hypothetical protein
MMSLTALIPTAEAKQSQPNDIPFIWVIPIAFFLLYTMAAYELIPGSRVTSEMKHKLDYLKKRNAFKAHFDKGIFINLDSDDIYHESLRLWRAENRMRRLKNFSQYSKIFYKGLSALDYFDEQEKLQEEKEVQTPPTPQKNLVKQHFTVNIAKPLDEQNPFFLLTSIIKQVKSLNKAEMVKNLHKVINQLDQADICSLTEWRAQYHNNNTSLKTSETPVTTFPKPTIEEKRSFQAIQHLSRLRKSQSYSSSSEEEEPIRYKYSKQALQSLLIQQTNLSNDNLSNDLQSTFESTANTISKTSSIEENDKEFTNQLFEELANTSQESLKLACEALEKPSSKKNLLNVPDTENQQKQKTSTPNTSKADVEVYFEAQDKPVSSKNLLDNIIANNETYLITNNLVRLKTRKTMKIKKEMKSQIKLNQSHKTSPNSTMKKKKRLNKLNTSQPQQKSEKDKLNTTIYKKSIKKVSLPTFVKNEWHKDTFQYKAQF